MYYFRPQHDLKNDERFHSGQPLPRYTVAECSNDKVECLSEKLQFQALNRSPNRSYAANFPATFTTIPRINLSYSPEKIIPPPTQFHTVCKSKHLDNAKFHNLPRTSKNSINFPRLLNEHDI